MTKAAREGRQGDILFKPTAIPEEVRSKLKPAQDGIIAEGEHPGRFHRVMPELLASGAVTLLTLENEPELAAKHSYYKDRDLRPQYPLMYLEVTHEVTITHEDHPDLVLTEGTYEIGRQIEVDPWRKTLQRVMD